jgi:hypothetical protein
VELDALIASVISALAPLAASLGVDGEGAA